MRQFEDLRFADHTFFAICGPNYFSRLKTSANPQIYNFFLTNICKIKMISFKFKDELHGISCTLTYRLTLLLPMQICPIPLPTPSYRNLSTYIQIIGSRSNYNELQSLSYPVFLYEIYSMSWAEFWGLKNILYLSLILKLWESQQYRIIN